MLLLKLTSSTAQSHPVFSPLTFRQSVKEMAFFGKSSDLRISSTGSIDLRQSEYSVVRFVRGLSGRLLCNLLERIPACTFMYELGEKYVFSALDHESIPKKCLHTWSEGSRQSSKDVSKPTLVSNTTFL